MNKALLIGGPLDGERYESGQIPPAFLSSISSFGAPIAACDEISAAVMCTEHVYRREKLAGQHAVFFIYIHESLTIDQALQRLVEGYNTKVP